MIGITAQSSGFPDPEENPPDSEFEYVNHREQCAIDPLYAELHRIALASEYLVKHLIETVDEDRRLMIHAIVSDIENVFADCSQALEVRLPARHLTCWLRDRGLRPRLEAADFYS